MADEITPLNIVCIDDLLTTVDSERDGGHEEILDR